LTLFFKPFLGRLFNRRSDSRTQVQVDGLTDPKCRGKRQLAILFPIGVETGIEDVIGLV
jgi:hypothetical protein